VGSLEGRSIAVVGAGPVGATLATVLAGAGASVDVYERRPEADPGGSATVNLSLSPHGMGVLDAAGLGDAVRAASVAMDARVLHREAGVADAWDYPEGWRNLATDRQALTAVARAGAAAAGARLHYGSDVQSLDPRRGGLVVDGVRRTADLLVGADGAYSAVRAAMARCPGFDVAQSHYRAAYGELALTSDGLHPRAIHIWPRGRSFMVALPHRDGQLKAALIVPAADAPRLADPGAYARQLFSEHRARILPTPLRRPTRDFVTVRCGRYHVGERCVLVGDAAHAMVPFMGQGVNAGLLDAAALARHLRSSRDPLPAYSAERQPEGVCAAELSLWNHGELCGQRRFGPPAPEGLPPVLRVNFTGESYQQVHAAVGLASTLHLQETA
jgi:kynurenine 3-monooxygenase